MKLCTSCEAEETRRADACYAAEKTADKAGEPYECECEEVVCTHLSAEDRVLDLGA